MDVLVTQVDWSGWQASVLENECVRTVIVPELGAKVVSLVDKRGSRGAREWLVGPGPRPLRQIPYGAPFHAQDLSGWDEMFPTIVACAYPGPGERHDALLPDHGEVWTLPWTVEGVQPGQLALGVASRVLPYRLQRTITLAGPATLHFSYQLTNLGADSMPYLWAAHPQFACGPDTQIVLPPEVSAVCNTLPASWGWGPPETRFTWPQATAPDGRRVRLDRVGPPASRQGRKFFALPHVRPAWAALRQPASGHWLRLSWDPAQVPYLGVWVDEGALSHTTVVAPEPTTGWYDDLALAWAKGAVEVVAPGATRQWTLTVDLGAEGGPDPLAGV